MVQFAVRSGTEQPLRGARQAVAQRPAGVLRLAAKRTGATKASNQSFLGIMMVLTLLFAALVGECSAAAPQPLIVGDTRVTALSERCAPIPLTLPLALPLCTLALLHAAPAGRPALPAGRPALLRPLLRSHGFSSPC